MINKLKYLPLILLFFWQCTERIEVEVDSTYTRLVVEGYLSTDTTAHRVRLTRTSDYFNNQPAPSVTGAVVRIDDGEKTIELTENPLIPGIYETEPDYFGIPGKTYTLMISDIDIDNDGNTEEYAAVSELNAVNDLDSIQVRRFENSFVGGYEILVYAWDSPEEDYYAFKAIMNGKLLTDTLNELRVQDDAFFNGNYTHGISSQFLVDFKEDERVEIGDTITFELNGITKEYFQYVMEAQSEIFFQTPLFSGPPANISTNIDNDAIGFFVAYSISRASVIVTEEDTIAE